MTSADGLEMVDLIGNNTNIKDCNFAEGERERERKKNTKIHFAPPILLIYEV